MRITVFGAAGRTGRLVVEQALSRGHRVTANVRNPRDLEIEHSDLYVVTGDALRPHEARTAVAGQDAVISAMGARLSERPIQVYSVGTANVMQAMKDEGVSRLVLMSAPGVKEDDPPGLSGLDDSDLSFLYRRVAVPLALRGVYQDMGEMEKRVTQSRLMWTIVRPMGLTNGPKEGSYRVSEGQTVPDGTGISRADVAAFMLDAAEHGAYRYKAVAVGH